MKTLTKILLASALTTSVALPAFAAEETTLAERNTFLYANGVETRLPAGMEAFAAADMHGHRTTARPYAVQDRTTRVDLGIASQR